DQWNLGVVSSLSCDSLTAPNDHRQRRVRLFRRAGDRGRARSVAPDAVGRGPAAARTEDPRRARARGRSGARARDDYTVRAPGAWDSRAVGAARAVRRARLLPLRAQPDVPRRAPTGRWSGAPARTRDPVRVGLRSVAHVHWLPCLV